MSAEGIRDTWERVWVAISAHCWDGGVGGVQGARVVPGAGQRRRRPKAGNLAVVARHSAPWLSC